MFHVLQPVDVYTRFYTESNDDEKYELDEYVDINLPPVIENGKVVYQTENELKDILNTCWPYYKREDHLGVELTHFPNVVSCKRTGDIMEIRIDYSPEYDTEMLNKDRSNFENGDIDDLDGQLSEFRETGLIESIPDTVDEKEDLFLTLLRHHVQARDLAAKIRLYDSSATVEYILSFARFDDDKVYLQYFLERMNLDSFRSVKPLSTKINIDTWGIKSDILSKTYFLENYDTLKEQNPGVRIAVEDELITYDEINIPCRLFTTELERGRVYDISTVQLLLTHTNRSPLTQKDITGVQIMDDALIESFNADHAQIQAGETKIQELHEHVAQQEQKLDQLSLEWRQLTKLVNLTPSVRDAKAAWKNAKKQAAQAVRDAKAAWQNAKKQARKDVTSDYNRLSAARRRVNSSIKRSRRKITEEETDTNDAKRNRHIRVVDMLRF